MLENANWSLIPEDCREMVRRYIEDGLHGGSFLTAVVSNDLKEACNRADDENRHRLFDYMSFFYNYAPTGCWGSPEKARQWMAQGGLVGLESKHAANPELDRNES